MFFGILNAFIGSFSGILWKKSLNLSTIPPNLFYGIGTIGSTFVAIIIIMIGKFEIPKESFVLAVPFLDAFLSMYNASLSQKINLNEKISNLLPYENLSAVITIIIAFFLFSNTSFITFLIAIAVIIILFLFSFDFKTHEFPKKFHLILLNNGLNSARTIAIGYFLAYMTSASFLVMRNVLIVGIVIWGIYTSKQIGLLKTVKKDFMVPRLASAFLTGISSLIGFTMLAKFGIITTTLLGFLSMFSTLTLGYFFLKDRPEKKNIILAVTISSLVFLGVFFK